MLNNQSPGPDKARVIERAIRHRLERHARVNPERIDDILRFATATIDIHVSTRVGHEVREESIQRLFREIEQRPGWLVDGGSTAPRESAMDRLKRANRESARRQ